MQASCGTRTAVSQLTLFRCFLEFHFEIVKLVFVTLFELFLFMFVSIELGRNLHKNYARSVVEQYWVTLWNAIHNISLSNGFTCGHDASMDTATLAFISFYSNSLNDFPSQLYKTERN